MGNRGFNSSQFLESSHRAIRKSDPLLPVAAAVVRVDGRTRPAGGIADPQDPVQSRRRAGRPPLSDPRRRTSGLGSGLDDLWRSAIFGRHPLRSSSHVLIASACVRRYRFLVAYRPPTRAPSSAPIQNPVGTPNKIPTTPDCALPFTNPMPSVTATNPTTAPTTPPTIAASVRTARFPWAGRPY